MFYDSFITIAKERDCNLLDHQASALCVTATNNNRGPNKFNDTTKTTAAVAVKLGQ